MTSPQPTSPLTIAYHVLQRRCLSCNAVVASDGFCADPRCHAPYRRDPLRCPCCLSIARWDDAGALACASGCVLAAPPRGYLDGNVPIPQRTDEHSGAGPGDCERVLPLAGWELVLRDRLGGGHAASATAATWGLGAMLDASAWSGYDAPKSRLAVQWGEPSDPGRETWSVEGARFESAKRADVARIVEMTDAIDAWGAAMRSNPAVRKRTGHRVNESAALLVCAAANDSRMGRLDHYQATSFQRAAINAYMREHVSELVHEVGAVVVKILVNAIVLRGGQYQGAYEAVSYDEPHTTPFGGYRAALAFAHYGQVGALGEGNPLAGLGAAEYKFGLPSGVQLDGDMAVNPTHNGATTARNARARDMKRDVFACLSAARIGGCWSPTNERDPEAPRSCAGGRALTAWEAELIRYCDVGTEVEVRAAAPKKGSGSKSRKPKAAVLRDFRRLAVVEAVERIRLDASARGRADIALAPARHLTTEAAKVALPKARRALLEALVAWGLIPQRETPPARQRVTGTDADEREPRRRTPTQAGKRAFESWDPEAMS